MDKFDAGLRRRGIQRLRNLAHFSSGTHRAQGTIWLGWLLVGCILSDVPVRSKVRNLGCGRFIGVALDVHYRPLIQLIRVGQVFTFGYWVLELRIILGVS